MLPAYRGGEAIQGWGWGADIDETFLEQVAFMFSLEGWAELQQDIFWGKER